MPDSSPGANTPQVVKCLVRSVVKCGKEGGKVGGKVPVLPGQGSLRRIFFWKYFTTLSVYDET